MIIDPRIAIEWGACWGMDAFSRMKIDGQWPTAEQLISASSLTPDERLWVACHVLATLDEASASNVATGAGDPMDGRPTWHRLFSASLKSESVRNSAISLALSAAGNGAQ